MNKLSVIILTKNEERMIAQAIKSIKNLSDDIVIVDSGSEDTTVTIAKKLGAHVFERNLDSFAKQRNFANTKTQNNWVLSMDADEEIPQALVEEIKSVLEKPEYEAYLIPRRNIIFGKEIKYTRWSPDAHVWLYNKESGSWEGDVHEEWVPKTSTGFLDNGKIHHSHENVFAFVEMLNRYTDIEAERLYKHGLRPGFLLMLFWCIRSFVGRFILKRGFLDGMHGFVLSILMSFYRFVTWAKVWERSQRNG